MANQIKKKYIENDAIDGLKLLLQSDQTLRRLMNDGSTQDVIAYLEGLISDEETRALSAEGSLDTRITTLEGQVGDDLQAAIAQLQAEIAQEASDRESADNTLQSNIDAEKARVDAILLASEADKDSFAEIVQLINSIDTENDQAFAAYVLSNDAALAQEEVDRIAGDTALQSDINTVKEYKPEQVIYVSKNGDDANSGSEQLPFLTLGAALASITDASPTKRYAVRVSSGVYVEANIALKANVFIIGEGAKEAVRIDSTVSMDSSFNGSGDHRSGFANVIILKAANFDWSSVTSAAGKLYFSQVVFASTVNMYGHNNAIAQAQFADCQIFGKLTISGINVGVFHNNFCWGAVELNQHPNGGMATILNAVGGTIGGELKLTTTVDDFNRRCSAFVKSCYTSQITIDGNKSYVDATNDSLPAAGATILNSGNLVRLNDEGVKKDLSNLAYPTAVNQPIMPANTNATNLGDWGKQWFFNFGYVHGSSGTDLYVISTMAAYDAAGDDSGKSIYIEADGYGLKENVDGGNISLKTASVSGTGVRGKILLDGSEIDVSEKQIKNLANGTDATDAVNKGQLDAIDSKVETEKARIDAILSASESDKDSFAEIVNLINSVDTENDQAFAAYVLSNNAALAQETSERENADTTLQGNIDAESTARQSADSTLQTNINAEASARQSADNALDVRISALESVTFEKENFVLTSTDVSNGYIDLSNEAIAKSLRLHVGRLAGFEGEDYELSTVGGVTRITFINSFASSGTEPMAEGDKVKVAYHY